MLAQQAMQNSGFRESLALAVWTSLPPEEQSTRMDLRSYAESMTNDARYELLQFERAQQEPFMLMNNVHNENIAYFTGRQWTPQEKQAIIDAGLKPYVDNKLRRHAITLLGEQIAGSTEWRAYGINSDGGDDDMRAEGVNYMLRWAQQENDWRLKKHYVFRDGVIGGRGIAQVRLDWRDPKGKILLERHRPQEFMWEISSATDGTAVDSRYFWRGSHVPRTELIAEFPEWADELTNFDARAFAYNYYWRDSVVRPWIQSTVGEGNFQDVQFDPFAYYMWRDFILKREFYRKRTELQYAITDAMRGVTENYPTQDMAMARAQKLFNYYQSVARLQGQDLGENIVSLPRPVQVDVVDKLTWAGDILLRVERSDADRYPYHVYCPEYYDGEITSVFQHGKDLQKLSNRMLTRFDQAAGGVKAKMLFNTFYVDQDMTPEEIRTNLISETEPMLIKGTPNLDLSSVAHSINPPPIGSLPGVLAEWAKSGLMDMYGGENSVGLEQTSAESGRAVLARQHAASLSTIVHFEEFDRFDKHMGQAAYYALQFIDPAVQRVVINTSGNPQRKSLVDYGITSLSDLDFKIEIGEVTAMPTKKSAAYAALSTLSSQNPAIVQYVTPLLLKYVDVDKSDIDQITQGMAQDKAEAQQQQMAQMEHEQHIENVKLDMMHLDKLIKLKELELAILNPTKTSIAATLKDPDPATLAGLMVHGGIPADTVGLAAGQALKIMMEQEKTDMQQTHRNKLLLPAERENLKPKAPKTVPSAKDRSNRSK